MHPRAQQVQRALAGLGVNIEVRELPDSTRTSVEAAAAIGTTVAQIAKSLIFLHGGQAVLAIVSGANRVSTDKLAARLGAAITQPDAKAVKRLTGYSAGGVPPVGYARQPATFIDEDLLQYDTVWAAAGTPHAVFALRPAQLVSLTSGHVMDLKGEWR